MKKILGILALLLVVTLSNAQTTTYRHANVDANFAKTYDPRSDTVDILHYTISLNITDFTNRTIAGNTLVKLKAKANNIQYLTLDLVALTVDSVLQNGVRLNHQHVNSKISIKLLSMLNADDTASVKVFYKGAPIGDVTGWGGFYFQNGFAYNLGVGFGADPHNYGRVWFPCFDNFMERSSYTFNITTNSGKIAYCNGSLTKDTTINGNRTRTWELKEEIPSYLASVAVGNYVDFQKMHAGINKNIPILFAILPSDSTNANLNVQVINNALSIYENRFGPYEWNRVGYALVPFNQGAMEHATNIAYPRGFINNLNTYSSVLVHELSHHWFGDLITCSSQEEMWLNEGWASYCEYIYTEGTRGRTAYINGIKTLHQSILQFAGYKEGFLNLNDIPHAYTYGDHVYLKGALMAHNLRAYMGDSLFFGSLKMVLAQNKYKSITNDEFINGLSVASGIDLSNYLNDWIKQGGWSSFSIDSSQYEFSNNKHQNKIYIKQSKFNNINYHTNAPIEISFINTQHQVYTVQQKVSGVNSTFTIETPFKPSMVVLNYNDKLLTARASDQKTITGTGNANFVLAKMNVNVLAQQDSSVLRIENYYTGAGGTFENNIQRISPQRYWKVDGILAPNFKANARIAYDGRTGSYTGNYYLDHLLNIVNEDSILLLYRKNSGEIWREFPYYTLETGPSKTNKTGNITIDSLWLGEYCLGMGKSTLLGINKKNKNRNWGIEVYPNPAKEEIAIRLKNDVPTETIFQLEIYDSKGSLIMEDKNFELIKNKTVQLKNLSSGMYILKLSTSKNEIAQTKFKIE